MPGPCLEGIGTISEPSCPWWEPPAHFYLGPEVSVVWTMFLVQGPGPERRFLPFAKGGRVSPKFG